MLAVVRFISHRMKGKKLLLATAKLSEYLNRLLWKRLRSSWTHLVNHDGQLAESQLLATAYTQQQSFLATQVCTTLLHKLTMRRLAVGFSMMDVISMRKAGVRTLLQCLDKHELSRKQDSLKQMKLHSQLQLQRKTRATSVLCNTLTAVLKKYKSIYEHQFWLSIVQRNSVRSQRVSLRRKPSTIRSNSLAREQTQRVIAGLAKLKQLVVYSTLEPFK